MSSSKHAVPEQIAMSAPDITEDDVRAVAEVVARADGGPSVSREYD